MEKQAIDLSWVTAAGGPELGHDGRDVIGMPEEGWWVWPDAKHKSQEDGLELNRHEAWDEPETGVGGTLLVDLNPAEGGGVKWRASFLIKDEQPDLSDSKIPCRGRGVAPDFESARTAALAWRPEVRVIDGVELWINPVTGEGEALELRSGELTWKRGEAKGSLVIWRFDPAGADEVARSLGSWSNTITGACDTLDQMLIEVDQARERLRAAMRKFLLNF